MVGRAVQSAATTMRAAKRRLEQLVPLGPNQVNMAPSELRRRMEGAHPDQVRKIMQLLGPEEALRILMGYKTILPGPRSQEEYFEQQVE